MAANAGSSDKTFLCGILYIYLSYNDIGNFGAERLAGVLGQCAALAYLNLSSKAEIRDR